MGCNSSKKTFGDLPIAALAIGDFKVATKEEQTGFMRQLQGTTPSGQTALYDAFGLGVQHLLKLAVVVSQLPGEQQFTFLHVLLTDGEDNESKQLDLDDCVSLCRQLSGLGSNCCTVLIGVDLNSAARGKLQRLADAGGENVSLVECGRNDIGDILNRVQIESGMVQRLQVLQAGSGGIAVQQRELSLELTQRKYAVWFNLDASYSMSGTRWNNTTAAVQTLLNKLTPEDMFGAATFNNDARVITK